MKLLVKIACIVLVLGLVLTGIGFAAGGHLVSSTSDPWVENALDNWLDRVFDRHDDLTGRISDEVDVAIDRAMEEADDAIDRAMDEADAAVDRAFDAASADDGVSRSADGSLSFDGADAWLSADADSRRALELEVSGEVDVVWGDSLHFESDASAQTRAYTKENNTKLVLTISSKSPATLTLPNGLPLREIDVKLTTGILTLPDLAADEIELENEYGTLTALRLDGREVSLSNEQGNLTAASVAASDCSAETGSGKLTITALDADRVELETESGALTASLTGVSDDWKGEVEAEHGGSITLNGTAVSGRLSGTGTRRLEAEAKAGTIALTTGAAALR